MRGNVRRSRKEIDADIMRRAAARKIGEDNAYWIFFGPSIARGLGFVLLAAGAAWVWFNVDHRLIGFVAAFFGVLMTLAYAASTVASTGTQARQLARATGRRPRPLWWHGVGAVGILLLALAYVAIPF